MISYTALSSRCVLLLRAFFYVMNWGISFFGIFIDFICLQDNGIHSGSVISSRSINSFKNISFIERYLLFRQVSRFFCISFGISDMLWILSWGRVREAHSTHPDNSKRKPRSAPVRKVLSVEIIECVAGRCIKVVE